MYRFELESGADMSVFAVSRSAFTHCRRSDRDVDDEVVERLSQNASVVTVTRRQLHHNQSNYFIGTSSTDCLSWS